MGSWRRTSNAAHDLLHLGVDGMIAANEQASANALASILKIQFYRDRS